MGLGTKPSAIYELFAPSYRLVGPNPYSLSFLGVLYLILSAYFVYQLGK